MLYAALTQLSRQRRELAREAVSVLARMAMPSARGSQLPEAPNSQNDTPDHPE